MCIEVVIRESLNDPTLTLISPNGPFFFTTNLFFSDLCPFSNTNYINTQCRHTEHNKLHL